MIELAAIVIVGIALVVTRARVSALTREIADLRARLDRLDPGESRLKAGRDQALLTRSDFTVADEERPVASGQDSLEAETPELIERQIGERFLLYAGMVVLVLGVAFFLRYAFDRQWLSPVVRVLLGGFTGVALIGGGQRLARAGYKPYGLFFCGGGFTVLFLSIYASFALYGMLGRVPVFALLATVVAGAALFADREASQPLAFMAVGGGFATPFLVGGSADAQITLFSYAALLIAATMVLARRREWPLVNVLSLALTVLTVAAWATAYYTPAKYLRTEAFLTLYCAMFVVMLRDSLRSRAPHAADASLVLWFAPVAYHLVSLLILDAHAAAFLIYIALVALVVVLAAVARPVSWLRLAGLIAVVLPLQFWIADHGRGAMGPSLFAVIVLLIVWLLFLWTQVRSARTGDRLDRWDVALAHVNGASVFAGLFLALAPFWPPASLATVAIMFAGVYAAVAMVTAGQSSQAASQWLALAAAFGAVALTIVLVPGELASSWRASRAVAGSLSQSLLLSASWAAYAGVLIAVGMRRHHPPVRYFAIGLFGLTLIRVFAVDLQRLEGMVRVAGFIAVGGILLLVSFLYQRSQQRL